MKTDHSKNTVMSDRKSKPHETKSAERSLSECAEDTLEKYFQDLDGHEASNLHELFISQVEKPLLKVAMAKYNGNLSKTAKALGLNRGTLRSRLKKHGLSA